MHESTDGLHLCFAHTSAGQCRAANANPAGLIGGFGLLLSFYSITGAWSLWRVLWPLVPLLILATVIYTFWLGTSGERKTERIHLTARRSNQVIFIAAIIVAALSFI